MAVTSSGTAKVTLPTDEQILITREFDAAPHLVYRAWTTPELVKRWWSGQRGEVTSVEIDLRVGGKWRSVMEADMATMDDLVDASIVPERVIASLSSFFGGLGALLAALGPNGRLVTDLVPELEKVIGPAPQNLALAELPCVFLAQASGAVARISSLLRCPSRWGSPTTHACTQLGARAPAVAHALDPPLRRVAPG